ncbi:uncharacterized protein NPIL_147811 [Nephila pilipes]|uniref:Uncharacterized protein n=1 Tax=Nephila pilipes TaxID=299642 RepID=A0A8X6T2X7_NEPPI|nr:uncharacterized protein NPIL_664371 [Nephila pilipes]GFS89972.1 uncharacterized protein NPIL_147811 [Nephila pilipes]
MSTHPSLPSDPTLLQWCPVYPNPEIGVDSSFRVLPEFFSGKENVSEFLDSNVCYFGIPTNLACAYLKGHLIGKARDWFEVIGSSYVTGTATDFAQLKQALTNSFPVVRNRKRDEGVVETYGLNGEGSSAEQVETEGSKGLANEESSKEGQWRGRRVRSKGSTESSNNKEKRHQSKRRPPVRRKWRKRSEPSSVVENTEVER